MVCLILVFWLSAAIASPAQTLTTLANFGGANGSNPTAGLVQGADGNFYGTTFYGGTGAGGCIDPSGCGTIFKITPSGSLSTLYSFCTATNCPDGFFPNAGLAQATDGNFYGATDRGGAHGNGGTIFKLSSTGKASTLYSFCALANCADGNAPNGGVVEGSDGNFYGTTLRGGTGANCPSQQYPYGCGTIFMLTPTGTLTTLYNFCSQASCTDGLFPQAGLVQGTDGSFYGTTSSGGANCSNNPNACGTVFKITPNGTFTSLHSFAGSDGFDPVASLVQGTNGIFYGTTAGLPGTVFSMTATGTVATLHTFSFTDGSGPYAGLIQGTDGNFYGTTVNAGGNSTVFKITTSGMLTTLHLFCSLPHCDDGSDPLAAVVQGTDGNLYGTTYSGGTSSLGTVFSLTGPSPTAVQVVPVKPCRLVDTRQTHNPIQGGTWQVFQVPQLGGCGIPPNAAAYSLNVTVVPHGRLGYLTIWPAGRPQPNVSTMNSDGRVKADAAIVPAGASAAVSVYVTDTTDLILDIDGYFTSPSPQTLQFYALPPCRVVDTRGPNGPLGGPFLAGGMNRDFPVLMSNCGLPQQGAVAYSFNFTALPHTAMGFITTCPTPSNPQNCPVVSTLNWTGGQDTANAAILPAGTGGSIRVNPSNDTDLLIDVNGYFAAPGGTGALSLYSVVPCRVLDTRPHPFQFALNPPVDVRGSVCAPPSQSQAYVFNATVVPQGGLGFLTLWPDGVQQPVVSTLNAFDGAITSNLAIVPAGQSGKVDAYASPLNQNDPNDVTNLILDISGYFAP